VTLPAFTAERRAAAQLLLNLAAAGRPYAVPALSAVDRYFLPAGRSAANSPATAAVVDRWDRQMHGWTDRQTDGRSTVSWTPLRIICEQCYQTRELRSLGQSSVSCYSGVAMASAGHWMPHRRFYCIGCLSSDIWGVFIVSSRSFKCSLNVPSMPR